MPRLLDVANAAGVSLRTASRVLNDDPRVAPETRQRVRDVISDLSFQPDAMARSLRAGTDTAIGFVVESIADPFFAAVAAEAEATLAPRRARVRAAESPVNPAPITATSTTSGTGCDASVVGNPVVVSQ